MRHVTARNVMKKTNIAVPLNELTVSYVSAQDVVKASNQTKLLNNEKIGKSELDSV
jgi:hypothetical protein